MKPRDEPENGYLTRCLIIRKTGMAYYNRSKCHAASPGFALCGWLRLYLRGMITLSGRYTRRRETPRSRNMCAYL